MPQEPSESATSPLRAAIVSVLRATSHSDPRVIAEMVAVDIGDDDVYAAFEEALPHLVRAVMHSERSHLRLDDASDGSTAHTTTASSSRSPRWESAASVFATRWFCGDAGWKQLGDCTRADVAYLVESRRKQAKQLDAAADNFEALAKLMRRRKVESVGQLSEAEVTETLA